jgi:NDP-sugar pyrophosphorylase family protein
VGARGAEDVLPPVCILAGGLGTRLGERVRDTPKPLLEVAGEPFLTHQLRLLAAHGAREAVLCVGYLGAQIQERIGLERFGIKIRYSFDGPELDGTLGAIRRALPLLGERFLVLNGDTYLPIDYVAAAAAWRASGLPALMGVLHNEDRHEPSNARYADGLVLAYDKHAPRGVMDWIDCGLGGFEVAPLETLAAGERELAVLLGRLAGQRQLCGFQATRRYYEIGTPHALAETDAFLRAEPRAASGAGVPCGNAAEGDPVESRSRGGSVEGVAGGSASQRGVVESVVL